jgi:hypothetical protein
MQQQEGSAAERCRCADVMQKADAACSAHMAVNFSWGGGVFPLGGSGSWGVSSSGAAVHEFTRVRHSIDLYLCVQCLPWQAWCSSAEKKEGECAGVGCLQTSRKLSDVQGGAQRKDKKSGKYNCVPTISQGGQSSGRCQGKQRGRKVATKRSHGQRWGRSGPEHGKNRGLLAESVTCT